MNVTQGITGKMAVDLATTLPANLPGKLAMKFATVAATFFFVLGFTSLTWAKGISTHILDLSSGKGGTGVSVSLEFKEKNEWKKISTAKTDANGRIKEFPGASQAHKGLYRLTFDLGGFYKATPTFFPEVTINFQVLNEDEHYHVPLVLSPYGYNTYRGN